MYVNSGMGEMKVGIGWPGEMGRVRSTGCLEGGSGVELGGGVGITARRDLPEVQYGDKKDGNEMSWESVSCRSLKRSLLTGWLYGTTMMRYGTLEEV